MMFPGVHKEVCHEWNNIYIYRQMMKRQGYNKCGFLILIKCNLVVAMLD